MPNVWWSMLAIAAAMSMPRAATGQVPVPADTGSTIQTTGSAQLTLQPTRAIITFGVASRAATAVSFQSDSAVAAQRRALAKAYEEALGHAQALAAAAGGTLGRLQTVSTEQVGGEYFAAARMYVPAVQTGIPMTPQGVTVSAAVAAVWRFTPRSGP